MAKEYKINDEFTVRVNCIQKDSAGNDFISVTDEQTDFRVYNFIKYQKDEMPALIYVRVRSIDINGHIRIEQDEARTLAEHYQIGKIYPFHIEDIRNDSNDKPYYVISDDFAEQRYYFHDNQKYQIGDDCVLEVAKLDKNGRLVYKEVEIPIVEPTSTTIAIPTRHKKSVFEKFGPESQTIEYKTSIIFHSEDSSADIDKQMRKIIRAITSFMNSKGGKLIIGVNDSYEITGIEKDFEHLNDESEDRYSGKYRANEDGYQQKIMNILRFKCSTLAASLIHISFRGDDDEGRFCVIEVDKADKPIWVEGTQLYIRQNASTVQLKGEELTSFVFNRMKETINERAGINNMTSGISEADIAQILRDVINERKSVTLAPPPPPDLNEIDYWIVWYNDGSWVKQRNESTEQNVHLQVAVRKNVNDPRIVFCYKSGYVSQMLLSLFRKGANMNVVQNRNGWSKTGEKPMAIFIVEATDLLVGYSIDYNQHEHVKIHSLSDYHLSKSAANQGAPFIPNGNEMTNFRVISAAHIEKLRKLIVTKQKRSTTAGEPIDSTVFAEEIEYLTKLL